MIEAISIVKYFGEKLILDRVSFSVRKGEICGYVGPNGAGKTTTIKILIGMLKPTSGVAYIGGVNVIENPTDVKRIIGYVPESGAVFETLTPMEFLTFVGRVYHMDKKDIESRACELMEIFEIYDKRNEPMISFSKGMKQKVILISALLHDPEVLFLDEPLNGLDARAIQVFKEIVKNLAEKGRTIFYSSHLLDVIEKICDKLVVINRGKVIAIGTVEEILGVAGVSDLSEAFAKLTGDELIEGKIRDFISKMRSGF